MRNLLKKESCFKVGEFMKKIVNYLLIFIGLFFIQIGVADAADYYYLPGGKKYMKTGDVLLCEYKFGVFAEDGYFLEPNNEYMRQIINGEAVGLQISADKISVGKMNPSGEGMSSYLEIAAKEINENGKIYNPASLSYSNIDKISYYDGYGSKTIQVGGSHKHYINLPSAFTVDVGEDVDLDSTTDMYICPKYLSITKQEDNDGTTGYLWSFSDVNSEEKDSVLTGYVNNYIGSNVFDSRGNFKEIVFNYEPFFKEHKLPSSIDTSYKGGLNVGETGNEGIDDDANKQKDSKTVASCDYYYVNSIGCSDQIEVDFIEYNGEITTVCGGSSCGVIDFDTMNANIKSRPERLDHYLIKNSDGSYKCKNTEQDEGNLFYCSIVIITSTTTFIATPDVENLNQSSCSPVYYSNKAYDNPNCPNPNNQKPVTNTGEYETSYGCSILSGPLGDKINWAFNLIKYSGVILAIALGMWDFAQAILTDAEDRNQKAAKKLVRRIIAAAIIFLIPTLTQFLLTIIKIPGYYNDTCIKAEG